MPRKGRGQKPVCTQCPQKEGKFGGRTWGRFFWASQFCEGAIVYTDVVRPLCANCNTRYIGLYTKHGRPGLQMPCDSKGNYSKEGIKLIAEAARRNGGQNDLGHGIGLGPRVPWRRNRYPARAPNVAPRRPIRRRVGANPQRVIQDMVGLVIND